MLQSLHHRLLLAGLLLLAGVAVAAWRESDGSGAPAVSRSVRSAPAVVRSSRAGAETLSARSSTSADGSRGAVAAVDADGARAVPFAGSLPGTAGSVGASDPVLSGEGSVGETYPVLQSGSEEPGFVSTPAFTPEVSFSNDHAWITNDPSAPGSSLSLDNQTAIVTASQPVPGSRGVALGVVVEDTPPNPVVVPDFSPAPGQEPADAPDLPTPGPVARRSGFSHQQELFRTRWGWAAYDQVQKILREETSD